MASMEAKLALFALSLIGLTCRADLNDGMTAYKAGDYKAAIPLLKAAQQSSTDELRSAALLSALVYEGRVDESSEAAEADAAAFPNSPEVIAARGELAFYLGNMPDAERLFRTAVKLKEGTPRAVYGLSRLYRLASMYRTARLLCLRAHEIDPDDALITTSWLRYMPPERREELLRPFLASHPWFDRNLQRDEQTSSDINNELNGREVFEFEGQKNETTLPLSYLWSDGTHIRGVGLELVIGAANG